MSKVEISLRINECQRNCYSYEASIDIKDLNQLKLEDKTTDEVIEYFKFENMVKNEPDFCPLYKDNKKCHDMEDLNCYLCACPNLLSVLLVLYFTTSK